MEDKYNTIFRKYYSKHKLVDRYKKDKKDAIDVIIPVIHTNELWENNLHSIYKEIPVNRLLISDGGCIDDTIKIAKKFPRVKIFDHKELKSLGYCLRKLIEEVETEWFIYPHSDVYLPDGWFDTMKKYKGQFEWFGCKMRHTVLVEYEGDFKNRPYAGSQIGKKIAFVEGIKNIDDDFVYRQEDFVFERIVEEAGYKLGKVEDTFHYHQTTYKPSPFSRKVKSVLIDVDVSEEEQIRESVMQVKGVIKYLKPSPVFAFWIFSHIIRLLNKKEMTWRELKKWIKQTNSKWLKYISGWKIWIMRIVKTKKEMKKIKEGLSKIIFGK